ncbi:PREDICTED: sodium/potassium/calcium exchanger 6, mitochondrial-like [Drosophila arizonae]|uniref:Sodium/potassium/calcium exchanger 6, mitochondrial-like n=1 Tax=Drosophila arizonae TaxID=7263 RepID=A0ABM1NQK8_DROAR|nr:PREDICTED: sodium/potassium/calcium exchanger 6, mitochondrial-like [Drosophila arizonae]
MDSKQYVPNELDKEFEQFWARVSCYAVQIFPYDQRCNFVQRANSCVYGTNVVPYIQLMACDLKCRNQFEEYVYVSLFLVLCLELLCCMSYVIHNFYGPALKLVARMMHMSEHLAGVTIMSFGNELPEIVANMWAVHDDDEPNFANAIAKGLYLIMFVGGLVCYISPFKMSGSTTIRDLLFMVCGVLMVDYFIRTDNEMDLKECIASILLYIIYLIVSVTDLLILRRTTRQLLNQINELERLNVDTSVRRPDSYNIQTKIDLLKKKYDELSEDGVVDILARQSTTVQKPDEAFFTYLTRRSERHPSIRRMKQSVAYRGFRNKNRFLFRQFFSSLRPVFMDDWIKGNILKRTFYIVRAPVVVVCAIYIPLVDYEKERDGWSKLLNCIQIFLNPAITIVIGSALIYREKSKLWYLNIPQFAAYGLYSMVITVPLAIIVFIHSNTSAPPKYHIAFAIMNFTGSVFLAMQCSYELSLFTKVIGSIYEIPFDFMGVTLLVVATCLSDLAISVSLSMQGYEKMAYAGTIGTSFLTVVVGCTTTLLAVILRGNAAHLNDAMGNYADNAYVIFIIGLFLTMLWTVMLDFNARRSVGIFSMSVFGIFLLFAVLIRKGIIHPYSHDFLVQDAYET